MNEDTITSFAGTMRGPVIRRGDPDYEEARKLYNGMIDKHPGLIARCADVADVITAVNFGRDNKLDIAIRGGGTTPGYSATIGGNNNWFSGANVSIINHGNIHADVAGKHRGLAQRIRIHAECLRHGLLHEAFA